ncbi:MAG: bifunctional riboflavin kinase/FAD synthetase [Alphaproteobacteria bacterium]
MQVFSDTGAAPLSLRGNAVALGNFDGVHRGHQAVIKLAAEAARARGLRLAAAVFEPHPRQFFQPDAAPFRLQSPGQRINALAALGVEIVFQIEFNAALAALTDEQFARAELAERIGAAHVTVGADFTFGKARMGDAPALIAAGKRYGFAVSIADVLNESSAQKVSSSTIRKAIAEGRMDEAEALLTRPWAIEGVVMPGQARGRTIGFRTANITLGAYQRPAYGVYAVRVVAGGARRQGVANIGVRPTVGGASEPLVEAHLFDFEGDLYGRRIEVELIKFLRPEQKFESFDALKTQIATDAANAKAALL